MIQFKTVALAMLALIGIFATSARAEEVVDLGGGLFGGGRALLDKPAGKPRAGLVLIPGGDGYIGIGEDGSVARGGNWIVRTRSAYLRNGIASLTLDANVDPAKAVEYMRGIAPRVIVVAMSRGALKVAPALAARPDGVVFTSSLLDDAKAMIGDPGRLPPTLIVHHRQDECRLSPPESATAFQQWTGGKARLLWIDGGTASGNPCQGRAHHGMVGNESQVVAAVAGFAGSLR